MQTAFEATTQKDSRHIGVVTDEAKKELMSFLKKLGHEVKASKRTAQEVPLLTTDDKLNKIFERVEFIITLLQKQ